MSKGQSKIKKAIDKIVKPAAKEAQPKEKESPKQEVEQEAPTEYQAPQTPPDLGQKTMPGILALRKKFGK